MTVASQRRMVFDGETIRIYIIEIERDLPSISVEVLRLGALRVSGIIVSGFGGDMNGKYFMSNTHRRIPCEVRSNNLRFKGNSRIIES